MKFPGIFANTFQRKRIPVYSILWWQYLDGCSAEERDEDSNYIDGQLELEELGYAVVDITAPHDSLDNAGEVIVRQDNIRRLFGDISAGDSLDVIVECFRKVSIAEMNRKV